MYRHILSNVVCTKICYIILLHSQLKFTSVRYAYFGFLPLLVLEDLISSYIYSAETADLGPVVQN